MPIDIDNQQYASVHLENENFSVDKLSLAVEFYKELIKTIGNEKAVLFDSFLEYFIFKHMFDDCKYSLFHSSIIQHSMFGILNINQAFLLCWNLFIGMSRT